MPSCRTKIFAALVAGVALNRREGLADARDRVNGRIGQIGLRQANAGGIRQNAPIKKNPGDRAIDQSALVFIDCWGRCQKPSCPDH